MKIYEVIHIVLEDGGYGDGIMTESVVFRTTSKEDADAWVKHWDHPVVYAEPYDDLYEFHFEVRTAELLEHVSVDASPTDFPGFWYVRNNMIKGAYDATGSINYEGLMALPLAQLEEEEDNA